MSRPRTTSLVSSSSLICNLISMYDLDFDLDTVATLFFC